MRKGFTLIEVLVVAVIVAILAAVAIPAYNGYIQTSKERVAKNTAGTVAAAIAAYYADFQSARGRLDGLFGNPGAVTVISADGTNSVKLPDDFGMVISAGIVTVTHKDGTASDSVPWR